MSRFSTIPPHAPSRRAVIACYALIVAGFIGLYAWVFADTNPITPDSRGYLYFSPDRTIGYQTFLMLLGRLSTSLSIVSHTQLVIVGLSMMLAAYAFSRLTGSLLAGMGLLVLGLGYPAPMKSTMLVTTEALSMACNALFAAIFMAEAHRRRRWTIPVLSALLFASVTIRPTNLGLLPAAILMLWLFDRPRRWRGAALLTGSVAAGLAITPLIYRGLTPGRPGDSPAARGLFGAALLAPGPGDGAARACGAPPFDAVLDPIKRHIAAAPDEVRDYLTLNYTNHLRFRFAIPRIMGAKRHRLRADANPIMMCYAKAVLAQHPGYLVARTMRNYWSIVSYRNYDRPGFKERLDGYLAASPAPLPPVIDFPDAPDAGLRLTAAWQIEKPTVRVRPLRQREENPFMPQPPRNPWLTGSLTAVLLASAAISLLSVPAALFVRWRTRGVPLALAGIAICGAAIHSVLMVSALFEIPVIRYIYPVWPLIALVLAWAGFAILSRLLVRVRPGIVAIPTAGAMA